MVKYFEENSNRVRRAVQAWQILVHAAMNRQTHTYKSLSILMYGHYAGGTLGSVLGYIAFYCNENNLPPLTALVVNSETGVPGALIPISSDLNQVREQVYQTDWYAIYPPTEQELIETHEHQKIK
ncbi:hypothetical protein LNQ82_00830 [Conchiformibius steedae DSM 2580]|uniref:Uncharacterized protein n=1 Tax=Conchiformibius steedae DSM 2580 TaxID=1121352 RepID=A0AAE9HTB1_9NEIS|nr:hypothetical protein [Conchiformibius steedae]QMT33107.1 hypothetical protein H3L98_08375 [Conchiformibius steedae]URD67739.1 hypothetical protein LNQ82_00830 [Conchiformibius steedae DSM 2580]